MRIYIRHAEKEYSNGNSGSFRHDPGIIDDSHKIQILATQLVEQWGTPYMIVCSPYRRARETAMKLAAALNNSVMVKCDVKLSEYLGNHYHEPLDVTDETQQYHPPHPEHFFQMDTRVRQHNDEMRDLDHSELVVWFVTHGIIMSRIANCVGYHLKRQIPYLSSFSVVQTSDDQLMCQTHQFSP